MKKVVITPAYYISEELLVHLESSDIIIISDAANPVFPFGQREGQVLKTMGKKEWDIRLVYPGEADVTFKTAIKEVLEGVEVGELVFTPTGDASSDIVKDMGEELIVVDDYRFGDIGDYSANYLNNSAPRWNALFAQDFMAIVTQTPKKVKFDADYYAMIPFFIHDDVKYLVGISSHGESNIKLIKLFDSGDYSFEDFQALDLSLHAYSGVLLSSNVEYYTLSTLYDGDKKVSVSTVRLEPTPTLLEMMNGNDIYSLTLTDDLVFIPEGTDTSYGPLVSWAWDSVEEAIKAEEVENEANDSNNG